MRTSLLISLPFYILLSTGFACSAHHDHETEDHDHAAEKLHHGHDEHDHDPHEHQQPAEEGHHHEADEIILHRHEADEMGVEVMKVQPRDFSDIINAAGSVLNAPDATGIISAPVSGIVHLSGAATPGNHISKGSAVAAISARSMAGGDVNEANRLALNAAKTELDRVRQLFDERMATRQELNAAQAAYDAACNASSGNSSGSAIAPVSGVITEILVQNGSFVNQGDPIAVVSTTGALTVKAEVASRYASQIPAISGASILYGDEVISATKKADASASSSTDMPGYIPVYFSIPAGSNLRPGAVVELKIATSPQPGLFALPLKAVIERLGNKFVYCRIDDDCYRKIPVTTGANNGSEIVITSGLHDGMEIVVKGASVIRLAETSGAIPEGHSHHH